MRKVFFSFHYDDVFPANQVRNMDALQLENRGFIDRAEFEKVERKGASAIKRWIDNQLDGTSVTVVLIGTNTHERPYVDYEIRQSIARGNGLVGVHINCLSFRHSHPPYPRRLGKNPLANHTLYVGGKNIRADCYYNTLDASGMRNPYDYIRENIQGYIEHAAVKAGK